MQIPLLPPEASTTAYQVDLIFLALLALSLFFLTLVFVIIVVSVFRYRRRSPTEFGRPPGTHTGLELGGMAFLGVLALGMFFWAGGTYISMFNPPGNAEPIFVTGKQWMWKAQHMTGQREINTLHIAVGKPVKLIMTSEDVIHDFYVPAFRVHTDVVPGRYTTQWFQPTQVGTYHLFCSQYCGTGHSLMVGDIIVMSPADYEAWLAGGPQQSPAQAGAKLFQDLGCDGCHRSDSLARAPNLVGLFGKPVRLNNGQTVTADENYVRESILNPTAKVVEGFQPIMPSFQGRVNEEQLFDLVAYVQSLGAGPSTGSGTGGAGTAQGQPFLPSVGSPAPGQPTSLPVQGGTPTGPRSVGTPSGPSAAATPPAGPAAPLGATPGPNATPGAGPASAAAGEQLFTANGCSGCHLANGTGPGPSLAGIYGKPVQLQGGGSATADDAYIRESVLNPTAKVVQGYQPIMPSFQGKLSDEQINQLIAYIRSLTR